MTLLQWQCGGGGRLLSGWTRTTEVRWCWWQYNDDRPGLNLMRNCAYCGCHLLPGCGAGAGRGGRWRHCVCTVSRLRGIVSGIFIYSLLASNLHSCCGLFIDRQCRPPTLNRVCDLSIIPSESSLSCHRCWRAGRFCSVGRLKVQDWKLMDEIAGMEKHRTGWN